MDLLLFGTYSLHKTKKLSPAGNVQKNFRFCGSPSLVKPARRRRGEGLGVSSLK